MIELERPHIHYLLLKSPIFVVKYGVNPKRLAVQNSYIDKNKKGRGDTPLIPIILIIHCPYELFWLVVYLPL